MLNGGPLMNSTTRGLRPHVLSTTVKRADRQPAVVAETVKGRTRTLGQPGLRRRVLDRRTIDQHATGGAIAGFQRCVFPQHQLEEGVVEGRVREVGIEPIQRIAQPLFQHDRAIIGA